MADPTPSEEPCGNSTCPQRMIQLGNLDDGMASVESAEDNVDAEQFAPALVTNSGPEETATAVHNVASDDTSALEKSSDYEYSSESEDDEPHHQFNHGDGYIYQPLPTPNSIRRLILEPGEDKDALVGRLEVTDLSQAHGPESFEAISYVWGSDFKRRRIIVNGKRMAITQSLRTALRQTRLPDTPRAVWADAICINQEDDEEKGYQVRMMGRIYEMSRCTLICLGYSAKPWPSEVAALIIDVVKMMDDICDDEEFSGDWNTFPWPKADNPLLSDKRWGSWVKLVTEPWFRRGWVVQEAALGHACRVLWAGEEISWLSILKVEYWLCRRSFHLIPDFPPHWTMSYLHSIRYLRECVKQRKALMPRPDDEELSPSYAITTLRALDSARAMNLKDPKDRIYAFMAFPTSDAAMPEMQPNYGADTTHLKVYLDFAVKYLGKTHDLDILGHVEHEEEEAPENMTELGLSRSFPSWVPRWDRGAGAGAIWFDHDRKVIINNNQEITLLNDNSTLRVKAAIIDSVKYVSQEIRYTAAPEEAVASVVTLHRDIAEQSIKCPGLHKTRLTLAILSALTLSRYVGDLDEWNQALEAFASQLQSNNLSLPPDRSAKFLSTDIVDNMYKRRFLTLGRGYLAVSSPVTRVGDVCAVISGTRSPFILREIAERPDHYTVIGPAYVESAVLRDDGTSCRMGLDEDCDDWRDWDLPVQDIFLC